jgi:hypothetical protein
MMRRLPAVDAERIVHVADSSGLEKLARVAHEAKSSGSQERAQAT